VCSERSSPALQSLRLESAVGACTPFGTSPHSLHSADCSCPLSMPFALNSQVHDNTLQHPPQSERQTEGRPSILGGPSNRICLLLYVRSNASTSNTIHRYQRRQATTDHPLNGRDLPKSFCLAAHPIIGELRVLCLHTPSSHRPLTRRTSSFLIAFLLSYFPA